jgi:hypothetical protein
MRADAPRSRGAICSSFSSAVLRAEFATKKYDGYLAVKIADDAGGAIKRLSD